MRVAPAWTLGHCRVHLPWLDLQKSSKNCNRRDEGLADLLPSWVACQRLGHITDPILCRASPGQYITRANLAETAALCQLTVVTQMQQDLSLLAADGMQRALPVCVLPETPPGTICSTKSILISSETLTQCPKLAGHAAFLLCECPARPSAALACHQASVVLHGNCSIWLFWIHRAKPPCLCLAPCMLAVARILDLGTLAAGKICSPSAARRVCWRVLGNVPVVGGST